MSARSEKPKNRKIKLVGGGVRWTRQATGGGSGGLKSLRRSLRKQLKDRDMTPTRRRAIKEQLKAMLAAKDSR